MQIFDRELNIDFMSKRKLAMFCSLALIIVSLGSLLTRGLALGVDFTGGTLIEVGYQEAVEIEPLRAALKEAGFEDALVQHFGAASDVLVRLAPRQDENRAELSGRILEVLSTVGASKPDMRRVEYVGPQVGDELTEDGGLAVLFALIAILIYVSLRFEYRFATGSVVALIHDVIITLGVFSLFQIPFDLSVLAAILAVIGYSLNDTIVVFDRIRENFRRIRKKTSEQVTNISINQTLTRTLITSVTTLIVLVALFVLGGEVIHSFALALIIGVIVGTYSSIYVASATTLALGVSRADMLVPTKEEGAEQDDRP